MENQELTLVLINCVILTSLWILLSLSVSLQQKMTGDPGSGGKCEPCDQQKYHNGEMTQQTSSIDVSYYYSPLSQSSTFYYNNLWRKGFLQEAP